MGAYDLAGEALRCRTLALELVGKPEVPVLLRLAREFDWLAGSEQARRGRIEDDSRYFDRRAAQEVSAAVQSTNRKARLAHLNMARRYKEMSKGVAHGGAK